MTSMEGQLRLVEVSCPLCGSRRNRTRVETTDALHDVPGTFRIATCSDCRHVYMNPQPTPDTALSAYTDQYGPHAAGSDGASDLSANNAAPDQPTASIPRHPWYLRPSVRRIPGLRRLYYFLTDTRGDFVPPDESSNPAALEVGCATGAFLQKLQSIGWTAQGVEPVAAAADVARRKGLNVHVGALESANFPAACFDAVFGWAVIEHLIDPRATLTEMSRVTRNGGWLAISLPNAGCWEPVVFGRHWYAWEPPRHLQFFTPRGIRRLVEDCGFGDVQILHQRNVSNIVGSLGLALKSRFPNSRLARRMLDWPDRPTTWWQLALAPVAIILATIRQGGRLVVVARRRIPAPSPE